MNNAEIKQELSKLDVSIDTEMIEDDLIEFKELWKSFRVFSDSNDDDDVIDTIEIEVPDGATRKNKERLEDLTEDWYPTEAHWNFEPGTNVLVNGVYEIPEASTKLQIWWEL